MEYRLATLPPTKLKWEEVDSFSMEDKIKLCQGVAVLATL